MIGRGRSETGLAGFVFALLVEADAGLPAVDLAAADAAAGDEGAGEKADDETEDGGECDGDDGVGLHGDGGGLTIEDWGLLIFDWDESDGDEGFEAGEDAVEGDAFREFEVAAVVELVGLDLGDDLAEGEEGDEEKEGGGEATTAVDLASPALACLLLYAASVCCVCCCVIASALAGNKIEISGSAGSYSEMSEMME